MTACIIACAVGVYFARSNVRMLDLIFTCSTNAPDTALQTARVGHYCLGMPSRRHESLLLLFQSRSTLAAEALIDRLVAPGLIQARASISSANFADLQPAEYRADQVVHMLDEQGLPVMGIVVEIQLSKDEAKRRTWPAYAINLHARIKCPVCVLVVTLDDEVARWAAQPIEIGPGHRFISVVLGPEQIREVRDEAEAIAAPERAVLSAMAHGHSSNVNKAVRVARLALVAAAGLDDDRSTLYADIVYDSLNEAARQEVQDMPLNRFNYEYQSDFAKRYVAQGRAEGHAEGCARLVKQLVLRYGPLGEGVEDRVRAASAEELDGIAERVLTAETLDQALGAMAPNRAGSP
jgi:hypothetical protein